MLNRDHIKTSLAEFFKKDPKIAAVYIFGSFVHGRVSKDSDLDVAILFRKGNIPNPKSLLDLKNQISDTVGMAVDLVCLNEASPVLAMQVLRKGEKIIDLDFHDTNEYYIRVVNSYDDLKRIRKTVEEHILNGRIYG